MNRRCLLTSAAMLAGLNLIARPLSTASASSAAGAGPIGIIDAWARASGTVHETTAYLTVVNHSTEPDWLIAVSSSRAERAELRRKVWKGLVVKQQILSRLGIPPMARTVLSPEAVEIHLTGLIEPVHTHDELPLTLTFIHAGMIEVAASVMRRAVGEN